MERKYNRGGKLAQRHFLSVCICLTSTDIFKMYNFPTREVFKSGNDKI